MQTILVIDDDESLRDTISVLLEQENFRTVLADNGQTGLDSALSLRPDLMIVDLRLPRLNGVQVCKRVREAGLQTPILVLSAIGDEVDKVLLLEMGADDYVVKPFGTRELLARVRALLRRAGGESHTVLGFSDVSVDLERRIVTRNGQEVRMTPAEYKLLVYFLHNPDRVLTRAHNLNSVWGYECYPTTRTIDAHIVRLRQKLEPESSNPRYFLTVHGVGYRFTR